MARSAHIIGQATDVHGIEWDVRERRPSGLGWDVMVGWPHDAPRGRGCGGVRVIVTVELAQHLADTRLRDTRLPIGVTTAKRIRQDLGIGWSWDAWWTARTSDLLSMTREQFCQRHGCSMGAASQRRRVKAGPTSVRSHD